MALPTSTPLNTIMKTTTPSGAVNNIGAGTKLAPANLTGTPGMFPGTNIPLNQGVPTNIGKTPVTPPVTAPKVTAPPITAPKITAPVSTPPVITPPIVTPPATNGEAGANGTNGAAGQQQQNQPPVTPNDNPTPEEIARQANQDAMDASAQKVTDDIARVNSGAVPLTSGQQAQMDDLKNQYDALIADQKVTNANAVGSAKTSGYRTGAAEYDTNFQQTIGAIISAGTAKVANLATKEAAAIETLTQSIKDGDIKAIEAAYNDLHTRQQEKATSLQSMVTEANTAIKDQQATALKIQEDAATAAKDQRDFSEKVKEFNATQAEKKSEFNISEANKLSISNSAGAGGGVPPEVVDAVIKNPALINMYSYSMKGKVLNAVIAASAGTSSNIGNAILGAKLNFDGATVSVKDATKKQTIMSASESAATNTMQLAVDQLSKIQNDSTTLSMLSSPKVRDAVLNLKKDWGGDPSVVAYTNYIVDTLNEYGKVISGQTTGAGVTDSARGEAEKVIAAGYNPEQLNAAFDSMKNAMTARMTGLQDAISTATIKGIGGDSAVSTAQTETANDTKLVSSLNNIKTSNPKIYDSASKMYLMTDPETGQPYTPTKILEWFPELITQ